MPDDPSEKPTNKAQPSSSTVGSAVGAMAATILFLVLDHLHVQVDATAAASIGGGMAAIFGYFLNGGKAVDTE
jgi:uncharacterized membrane protein YjjB (DUF3815 family)